MLPGRKIHAGRGNSVPADLPRAQSKWGMWPGVPPPLEERREDAVGVAEVRLGEPGREARRPGAF